MKATIKTQGNRFSVSDKAASKNSPSAAKTVVHSYGKKRRKQSLAHEFSHDEIIDGLPIGHLASLSDKLGIGGEELATYIGLSRTTYHRRVAGGATLDAPRSDALAKYSALFATAKDAFDGDEAAAREWLKSPQHGLGGAIPLELARTTIGYRQVEKLLVRIDQGVYA